MACDIDEVCEAPCLIQGTGPTFQNWALAEFLLRVLTSVDAGAEVDPDTILEEHGCLNCRTESWAKAKQVDVIANGLTDLEARRLHCKSPAQVEAIKLYVICSIINAINP